MLSTLSDGVLVSGEHGGVTEVRCSPPPPCPPRPSARLGHKGSSASSPHTASTAVVRRGVGVKGEGGVGGRGSQGEPLHHESNTEPFKVCPTRAAYTSGRLYVHSTCNYIDMLSIAMFRNIII